MGSPSKALFNAVIPWRVLSQAIEPHSMITVPVFTMAGAGKWNAEALHREGAGADQELAICRPLRGVGSLP